jgi:hypothetical protein
MPEKNENTGRFGGPGSSHQDRARPGKNRQPTGDKHGERGRPEADEPTNSRASGVSGGGEHHAHTGNRS